MEIFNLNQQLQPSPIEFRMSIPSQDSISKHFQNKIENENYKEVAQFNLNEDIMDIMTTNTFQQKMDDFELKTALKLDDFQKENHQPNIQIPDNDQIQKYKKAYIKQQAKYHSIVKDLQESNQKVDTLKKENKKIREELNIARDLLLKEQFKNQDLEKQIIAQQQTSSKDKSTTVSLNKDSFKYILNECQLLKDIISTKSNDALNTSINTIIEQLTNNSSSNNIQQRSYQSIDKSYLSQLQTDIDSLKEENSRLKSHIPQYKRQVAYMRQNIDQMRETVAQLNKDKQSLVTQLEQKAVKQIEMQNEIDQLKSEFSIRIDEIENEKYHLQSKVSEIESQLRKSNGELFSFCEMQQREHSGQRGVIDERYLAPVMNSGDSNAHLITVNSARSIMQRNNSVSFMRTTGVHNNFNNHNITRTTLKNSSFHNSHRFNQEEIDGEQNVNNNEQLIEEIQTLDDEISQLQGTLIMALQKQKHQQTQSLQYS